MTSFDILLDLLDHGCDGEPRWMTFDAPDAHAAAELVRLIGVEAERRGYVAIDAARVASRLRGAPADLRDRAFALVQTCAPASAPDLRPLLAASAWNARPHVLLTIAVGQRARRGKPIVREARAAYAPSAVATLARRTPPESHKYVVRAEQAFALARRGRHEPAIRILREALAALIRRRDADSATTVGVLLGRVLLERGKADAAATTFADVAALLDARPAMEAATVRVWMALARTDAARLTDAEGMLRALRLAAQPEPTLRQWIDAVLARCLLWQNRADEAAQLFGETTSFDPAADPTVITWILATDARVRVATGYVFEAGQRARAAAEWAARSRDPVALLVAEMAQLRVLAAAGDVELAGEYKAALVQRARDCHAPLYGLRAGLMWVEMLRQSGRDAEAARELRRCARMARAAPQLLKRRIAQLESGRSGTARVAAVPGTAHGMFALSLLRRVQEEDDDRAAIQKALDRVITHIRAARVEVQSAAGGALTTLLMAGSGLAPQLGQRCVEAGIIIGPEQHDGGWQAAVPVRTGHRVLAALVCRWPAGRDVVGGVTEAIDLAAVAVAPRVDSMLSARVEVARAAAAVPELLGASHAIAEVRRSIARAAAAPFTVLIEGESGVGKELVARAIHHLSVRRDRRLCDVNCAALPEDLVEAELFGHAKGAFTGALVDRRGLFEEANGGTLFLDELPDLSLRSQAKLLRVLQQGEIRRLGETIVRRVDVRVVAATNRAMSEEVTAGRFRQDLLYRIDVIRIRIPPLRERPEDVAVLAQHFWAAAAQRVDSRAALSHALLSELSRYHWPGNVRELQNVMSALAVAAPGRGLVRPRLLPSAIAGALNVSATRLKDARREFERRFIEIALAHAGGSRSRAARRLGVSRQGLLKLMARVGVEDRR
jgi:DNA-binding NtrC family response regulator